MVKENLRKKWRRGQLSDGREARRVRNTEGKDVDSSQGKDSINSAQDCQEVQQGNRLKIFQLALVKVAITLANVPSGEDREENANCRSFKREEVSINGDGEDDLCI